jgi:hypothetical protein
MFVVIIENHDEEFEIIEDEISYLSTAIEIAKKVPIETYKAIEIDLIDPNGRVLKRLTEDGEEF